MYIVRFKRNWQPAELTFSEYPFHICCFQPLPGFVYNSFETNDLAPFQNIFNYYIEQRSFPDLTNLAEGDHKSYKHSSNPKRFVQKVTQRSEHISIFS